MKVEESAKTVNLQDDHLTIMFGPQVESIDNEEVSPFYISLRIH